MEVEWEPRVVWTLRSREELVVLADDQNNDAEKQMSLVLQDNRQ
jgi:hypothetical protein